MNINNALNSIEVKSPKTLFKTPNTTDLFYGKDQPDAFRKGASGTDIFTSGISQTIDWDKKQVEYHWNSLGLRGPEPDYSADNKILFAGGSFSIGTGVPVEDSFPYVLAKKLNASYINLSDADTLSDLIDPLKKFADFNPNTVVISDTRFIQLYGWVLIDIFKVRNIEGNNLYKQVFLECDRNFLLMFESYLKNLFPNATLVLAYCARRAFKMPMPVFEHFKIVKMDRTEMIDLARDNAHPGIETHKAFANKIYTSII